MTPTLKTLLLALSLVFASISTGMAQEDSVSNSNTFRKHSVRKAAIMSAALPGLGQLYNRKWWKLPIIYGGLGTLGYFAYRNHQYHLLYRREYNRVTCTSGCIEFDPSLLQQDPVLLGYSETNLIQLQSQYRKWRDLCFVGFAAVWALQIVDATVDAQMFDFDISPDLSFHWEPRLGEVNGATVSLRLR